MEEKNGAYQGQINYTLYKLAQAHSCNSSTQTNPTAQNSCVFYDVTAGNNEVPCVGGSTGCASQQSAVNGELTGGLAGTGYDLATGLGSMNATNLANFWNSVSLTGTQTTLQLPASFTHGSSVTVSGSVAPAAGTGTPTGILSLTTGGSGAAPDVLTLASGAYSAMVRDLPGGTYNVSAHYAGDAMFAASDSPGVAVNILPEASSTFDKCCGAARRDGNVRNGFERGYCDCRSFGIWKGNRQRDAEGWCEHRWDLSADCRRNGFDTDRWGEWIFVCAGKPFAGGHI